MDALDLAQNTHNSSTSLRVSLELSINNIKKSTLKFFGFIGLFPGGISEGEITKIWGNDSWIPLKDELIRASLLVYKRENDGAMVYSMLPFMTVRASEYLENHDILKKNYHSKCCQLYTEQ
mmetsp:Transcript_1657/g.1459  ORF Transcript_1657/g.1459 Transcript_1657/m.1459 type:complete len:121 (-) Transcript_1657:768-1130(-)